MAEGVDLLQKNVLLLIIKRVLFCNGTSCSKMLNKCLKKSRKKSLQNLRIVDTFALYKEIMVLLAGKEKGLRTRSEPLPEVNNVQADIK